MSYNFKEFVENASSQGSKSNIVKPLLGLISILLVGVFFLFKYNMESLAYVLIVLLIITFVAFIFTYFYCLFTNADLLRSEKYNLEKTAMEKISFSGDSVSKYAIDLPAMEYVKAKSLKEESPKTLNE